MQTLQLVVLTVLVFFVIVSIHEFGHYFFARRAGILVREFAIGFGPKLLSFKRGETRFTLRLLPFGGFARMAGEDPEMSLVQRGHVVAVEEENGRVKRIVLDRPEEQAGLRRGEVRAVDLEKDLYIELVDEYGAAARLPVHPKALVVHRGEETQIAPLDRQFLHKPVGKRAMAIFAGPLMNFLLAFVLFGAVLQMTGVPDEHSDKVFIGGIALREDGQPSPAEEAGLREGDWVKAIDGQPVGGDIDALVEAIGAAAGRPMTWTIERDGQELTLTVTPDAETGKVGFYPMPEMRAATAGETIRYAGVQMVQWTQLIFDGFRQLVTGNFRLDDIGGPVKTTQVTYQVASQGIDRLTAWTAVLSLYLGIFNLLPIPALDGSRLLFLGFEALRGRPVNPNRESMVHLIGFAMLMLLMLVVTYNDILGLVRR
jgi:regulator of sigma E protease